MSAFGIGRETPGRWRLAAIAFVILWFGLGGIAHFVFTDALVAIVPSGLPWRREAVWITGAFELLGAVGLLLPRKRPLAGIGLILLTICVTPANVTMWLHAERYAAIPEWLLLARLPFQLVLLAFITFAAGLAPSRHRADGNQDGSSSRMP
ncbi:DoxX family protein [Salinicola halophilus]|uniref:DoxX family protein n=1 Tax=Salinicola halophilus TaxID=184065 RepID=UPI001EF8E7FD|nr:DoxX family protein [Salinicola halophilus]